MKIVLLSMNFAPELTGIGKYSGEMADALVERGHEVTVVCAPPYYPQWKVPAGYSKSSYRTEQPRPGLTVVRCPVWIPERLSGLKRLVHLASFAFTSFPVLMRLVLWRPDVVFVVAPALFSAPAGWLTARLSGAKAWLHVQDLEVDAAFELGLLKGALLRRIVQGAERLLMRGFDVVSTISRRMLRQVASKGVELERTELIPNWIDLQDIRPAGRSLALRESLGIAPDQFVGLFSGTINRKQGLGVVIDAARLLRDQSEVVLVICGNGELRGGLEADAADLRNVRFLDLRPATEFNALLTGPLEPTNRPYALAKIAGIEMCWSYNRQYGTRYLAAMPSNLYGPGDNYDPLNGHVIPALLRKFHEAKPHGDATVTVWGSGTPRREFLYVDDMAAACVHLMELPDARFNGLLGSNETATGRFEPPVINIGVGHDITIRELALLIQRTVGYEGVLKFDTSKPDGTPRKLLDVERLRGLGWVASTPLEQGLKTAYAEFRASHAGAADRLARIA